MTDGIDEIEFEEINSLQRKPPAERHPHDEFIEADAEFSKIMREYNEVCDRLWVATKRRTAAWNALRDARTAT